MAVDYSKYHSILDSYEPYQPPAPVDQAAPKQNASALADFGTDLKRGLQQVPSAVTGLLDIPVAAATGRPMVSEGWEGLGQITGFQPQKWSDEARAEYSPERQAAQQQAAQAEGFADTAGVYLSNPSMLAGTVLESVPSIALGGVYARGLQGVGALSGVTRAGIGEGAVMAGQSMDNMVEEGVDPRRAAAFATGVGALGGALGVAGGSLTQRLGLLDADVLAAGGARAAGSAAPGLVRRITGGAITEGLFEELPQTLVETAAGNLAADRPWDEGLGKNAAVGLLAGGLMGGVVNIPGARRQRDMTQDAPPQSGEAAPVEQSALQDAIKTDTVPVQNWIDQQLRIGVSPAQTQKDAKAAFEGKIEPRLILDENGVPRTTTSAFDVYEFQNDFDARMAKQASRQQGTTATPVEPQAPQQVDEDPAVASLRTSQFAGTIFKKDGAMRQNADKAWKAYNEFADTEIDAAIEELAPQPKAGWRIAMLESIRAARAQEPQAQGAPNVAQVDAASGQGAGAVPAGSAGNAPSGPVVLDGVRQPAGAPAPGSAAAIPVGEPIVQQPASVADRLDAVSSSVEIQQVLLSTDSDALIRAALNRPDLLPKIQSGMSPPAWAMFSADIATAQQGSQPTNVPPTQQVDAQAEEARGQEGAQSVAAQTGVTPPARPTEDTPEARAAYIGELRGFLNASVAAQPQEVADAMRAVFGGFRQVSDVASALMNARNGLIERHRERFGAEPDAAALRKIDAQLAKLHKQMSENADDPVTSSLRAAARDLGVSHETVRTRMNKGVAALQQAATEAGIDIDAALEMTGVKPSAVLAYMDSISEAEAAQMGLSYRRSGPRTTRNAGDDAFNLDDAGADYFEQGLGGAVDEDTKADAGVQDSTIDAQAATDQADEGVDFDAMASEERGRAERVAERTNTFATERDHNGNPLRDVDFQEAAEDYNESVDTAAGDLSFEQLDRARQVAYTKAYVANMDGALSAQQLMRVFGDIADATRAKQDAQANDQRAAQEEGAVAQVQGTVQGGREGSAETGRAAREEVTDAVDSATAGFGGGASTQREGDSLSQEDRATLLAELEKKIASVREKQREFLARGPVKQNMSRVDTLGGEKSIYAINKQRRDNKIKNYERTLAGYEQVRSILRSPTPIPQGYPRRRVISFALGADINDATAVEAAFEKARGGGTRFSRIAAGEVYTGTSSRLLQSEGLESRGRRRVSPNVSGNPERGASRGATPDDIMVYYANAKEKDDLFDDRQLDDTGTPGLEVVYWGDSSTFGPFSRILTHGGVEGDGRLGFYVTDAQSIQEAGEIGITSTHGAFLDQTSLLHVMATQARDNKNRVRDNVWEVGFQGPTQKSLVFERLEPNGVSVVPDPDPTSSDPYTRLEGISKADVKDMLAEVRRRITRYQGGRVPNIVFTRETGAVVGKRGFVPSDVVAKRFSNTSGTQGTTVEAVRSAINDIATPAGNRKITVVQSADELIERGILNSNQARGTQGYVTRKGDAYFIADNIRPGNELAVVLHEIGAHLGIENLLTDKQYETLVKKIFDWAQSDANTQESRIARAAIRRVAQAKIENEADLSPETIAYFIEEAVKAGVNPTAMQYKTELGRWFRTLWAAFKVALRRLNLINADRLTAQNVVDLAYGAARVQLAGQYHGTAANFRRFDHRFMGSGEGAQAFGWGTYLAQRFGIANEYFEADVGRKSGVLYKGEAIKQSWPRGQEPTDLETALAAVAARFADSYSLRKALQKGTVTASDFKSAVADAQYDLASDNDMAAHDALENVRPEDFGVGQAEGNIHITDVNATEDELLDWDKPLSEQSPQVREALEAVFDNYDIGIAGYDNLDMTGEQVYKRLSGSRGLGSDKAASEYLDSLGIKGIKFLDAMSRGKGSRAITFDGKTYTDEDLRRAYDNRNHPLNDYAITLKQVLRQGVDKTLAELRAKFDRTVENFVNIERESLARFDMPYDAEKVRSDVEYRVKSTLYGREFDWLQKNKDRIEVVESQPTRNLVVFNDANIFRVGSMRGGPVGKGGRMMFSKTADPQLTELAQETGQRALKAIQAGIRKGWTGLAFSSHLANAAHRAGLTSARALELVQRKKATRAYEIQIEVEKVLSKFADLKGQINGHPAGEEVQRFVYDATFDKKWGFKPDWKGDAVVDPKMESRFKALPADAQAVIKDVFRHGDAIFKEKQDLLRKTITGEYEALIKVETDDGKRRKLERQRDKELREAGRLIAEMNGPYAPLRRYGNYVVVAKSQKYRDAEASGPVDVKLKRDENHYVVEFAETLYEAERLQGVLEGKFGKGMVWAGEKEESTQQFGELPFMAVQRLRKMVDTDLDGDLNTKSKRTLNKLLVDLYISTLHEANARHSEQKRQFVNRADRDTAAKDMMRAFATQGRADSHLVSALQFNSEIVDEMQKLRNEAKNEQGDSKLKTRLRNEILQRHMMDLDFRETPVQDKLMSLNSFWMLLTSPGYYVQNATQVMLMTQPVLAGKFGQNRSMRQLMRGYQDAMRVLKGSSWNEAADLSRFNGTADEKAMLVELQARGTLDFGISAELGYWESRGEISKVFNQVMRKVGMGTRKLEVLNRMSSALAAYRMMYDQTTGTQAKRHAAALDYADSIIKDTHGDYSTANAPRYLRMLPKVMTQFRKFQLIQLSLFAKTMHGSLSKAQTREAIEERRVARAALGYLFMNHALLAGAVGVPASALLGAIYAIAGDDDDPNDWEVDVRRAVGDKEMADLILHGLPSLININMSNKIGAGTMLDPLPFVEYEATRGGYEKAVTAAMGPLIGGLGAQVVDAFGRILKGDVAQGAAQLLPRGFRDAARGFMAAQDGIKLRNGQTALTPEELSFYDSLMMGLGLPTLKTTSRTETQFKSQQYETFFRERVTKLKRQYSEAYEENDREAMLEARQAWAEMQASRKNLGFKVQPLSDLLKAPREKAKAEAKLENGIRTTEQARGFVKSLQ